MDAGLDFLFQVAPKDVAAIEVCIAGEGENVALFLVPVMSGGNVPVAIPFSIEMLDTVVANMQELRDKITYSNGANAVETQHGTH